MSEDSWFNRTKVTLGRIRRWFTPKRVIVLLAITGVGLFAIALGTYELILATESTAFCGNVCHTPMYPEYTTYQASPHSIVPCTGCHVGAGTYNLVSSKARGIPQIFEVLTNRFPRPILLAKSLRPARETCEKCHTPSKFTGFLLRTSASFGTDETNTRQTNTIILNVGGGTTGVASGIHWHTAATVWYLPMDAERLEIGWVRVEKNGVVTEYINPTVSANLTFESIEAGKRRMDCVDCHNRASHIFRSPDDLINQTIAEGRIDGGLPYIKREALNAIGGPRPSLEDAYTRVEAIKGFYRNNYPGLYSDNITQIDQAVNTLKTISNLTTFPEMRVDWNTHADHSGHNEPPAEWLAGSDISFYNWRNNKSPGCFRCHGLLIPVVRTATGFVPASPPATSPEPLKPLDASCNLCHYSLTAQPGSPVPRSLPHPAEGLENCLVCHGLGTLKPFPEDHPWTNNEACVYCHEPPTEPVSYPVTPIKLAKNIPHTSQGLEDCLVCHGPASPKPFAADHPWSSNETCAACHQPAPQLLAQPHAPPPAGNIPVTSHSTRGLENCLLCHGPASPKPFAADHPWTTNDTCATCHTPASQLLPLPAATPPAGTPDIPHSTRGLENCLLCHGPTSPRPFVLNHPWTTNETCAVCHATAPSLLPVPPSTNLAPRIPHTTEGMSDCRLCHAPGGPAVTFPVNHTNIPGNFCTMCHLPAQ